MADQVYRVLLSFETTGNLTSSMAGLGAHAKVAESHVHGLKEAGKMAGEAFVSMGERAGAALERIADKAMEVGKHLAEVGGAAGVAIAAYGFHINAELEQTKLSIASMFQAHGLAGDFEDGLRKSNMQLAQMKQDVKSLPGDLGQLSSVMKMITTPGAAGGASADQIRKLAGQAMLVGMGVHGLNSEMVAREMSMILQGHAGGRNVLGQLLFSREEAHKLTGMSAEARWKLVSEKLSKQAEPAHEAFSHTWMAQWTTLKDNVKYSMLAEATQPLFERVKSSVSELNEYIEEHQDRIRQIAEMVGVKLAAAWDKIEEIVKRIAPTVERIGDKVLHMTGGQAMHGLAMGGAGMLGVKAAGMGLEAGSGMLGMLLKLAPALSGGGGAAFAEGLGALANPATLLAAGAAASGLAILMTAVAGAIDTVTDETNRFHDEALQAWQTITVGLEYSFDQLKEAASNLWEASKPLVDALGVMLLDALAEGVTALAGFVQGLNEFASTVKKMPFYAAMFPGQIAHDQAQAAAAAAGIAVGGNIHSFDLATAAMVKEMFDGTGVRERKAGMGGGGGGTHIQKVEIVVKGSDDPSRVARLTLEEIKKLGRSPRSSPHVTEYSSPR